MDRFSPEVRSRIMSRIRGRDTKPEVLVRSELHRRGFRFRKNDARYPGKPDIVLPKYGTVVMVNGCFWHQHTCGRASVPKTNVSFWRRKFERNRANDLKNARMLKAMGWRVLTLWECQLAPKKFEKTIERIVRRITK